MIVMMAMMVMMLAIMIMAAVVVVVFLVYTFWGLLEKEHASQNTGIFGNLT